LKVKVYPLSSIVETETKFILSSRTYNASATSENLPSPVGT
jgi:hypothetical protein